jgi:hypothetical protein
MAGTFWKQTMTTGQLPSFWMTDGLLPTGVWIKPPLRYLIFRGVQYYRNIGILQYKVQQYYIAIFFFNTGIYDM